jgi:tubulin polyglutamylase TTLL6/13
MDFRIMCGKFMRLDPELKETYRKQFEEVRDEYEDDHLGRFEKIYPVTDPVQMQKYLDMQKYARKTVDARDNKLGYSPNKIKRNVVQNN